MRLRTLQILNYKTISDSGRTEIRPHVTCLLGKNESGKSAVLQAMWKSKNVAQGKFDLLYDYPKERFSRDRKTNPRVTSLGFDFETADVQRYEKELDQNLPRRPGSANGDPPGVLVHTTYDGKRSFEFDLSVDALDTAPIDTLLGSLQVKAAAVPSSPETDPAKATVVAALDALRLALADPS